MNLDALLPGHLAATYFGVSRQLIYRWRQLGHITPAGTDRNGHPLYRLGDLLAAERATRRSPRSTRNPARRRPTAGPDSWAAINQQTAA